MATETEAIEEYIAHQQQKINELVQEVMMLETRNHIQDKELEELNNINKKYKDEINAMRFKRDGVSTLVTDSNLKTRNETIQTKDNSINFNNKSISGKAFSNNMLLRRD
tara:strand:- start:317 stop:643 length:327 start_codon:yes stop_codon:yes gene_type:complete